MTLVLSESHWRKRDELPLERNIKYTQKEHWQKCFFTIEESFCFATYIRQLQALETFALYFYERDKAFVESLAKGKHPALDKVCLCLFLLVLSPPRGQNQRIKQIGDGRRERGINGRYFEMLPSSKWFPKGSDCKMYHISRESYPWTSRFLFLRSIHHFRFFTFVCAHE